MSLQNLICSKDPRKICCPSNSGSTPTWVPTPGECGIRRSDAAFIIGGKTIDSVLQFSPNDGDKYIHPSAGKMATMKHQFEDLSVIFCDEISMVGSRKLLKINYRLQDIVDDGRRNNYMGGVSFVASGNHEFF